MAQQGRIQQNLSAEIINSNLFKQINNILSEAMAHRDQSKRNLSASIDDNGSLEAQGRYN